MQQCKISVACSRCGRAAISGGTLCLKCRLIEDAAAKVRNDKRRRFERLVEWCRTENIRELAGSVK